MNMLTTGYHPDKHLVSTKFAEWQHNNEVCNIWGRRGNLALTMVACFGQNEKRQKTSTTSHFMQTVGRRPSTFIYIWIRRVSWLSRQIAIRQTQAGADRWLPPILTQAELIFKMIWLFQFVVICGVVAENPIQRACQSKSLLWLEICQQLGICTKI